MRNLLFLLFISLIFISCSSNKTPYSPSIIDDNFTHNSLKTPILNKFDLTNLNNPTNQTNTTPSNNQPNSANQPPQITLSSSQTNSTLGSSPSLGSKSTPLTIINPMGGSAITVWALASGNWLWGYTLDNSKEFGRARSWQVLNLGDDIALIINFLTNTCIHDEGGGITHRDCDINNKSQQWQLSAMDNGAIQIKSSASSKCITTDLGSLTQTGSYYSLAMRECNFKPNFNQQWVFIPEAAPTSPLLGYQQ
ncbi:ricin-type beta-trefoil lectin domain protein [Campylobacter devanensis]|uniref:ricin-type beta-trefoil lectin domain protein n=1 Tax=Campylobacter devanensis TaxID=3161138 RepID=UPI000A359C23|nr:ricin-type beta-trefoil lectin domain protein [Campylobacter sp. P155]